MWYLPHVIKVIGHTSQMHHQLCEACLIPLAYLMPLLIAFNSEISQALRLYFKGQWKVMSRVVRASYYDY